MAGPSLNRGELAVGIPWGVGCKVERESLEHGQYLQSCDIPASAPAILGWRAEVRIASSLQGIGVHWQEGVVLSCSVFPQVFTSCSSCSSSRLSSPRLFTDDFVSNLIEKLENGYMEWPPSLPFGA